jgi:uncharacterized protein YceK
LRLRKHYSAKLTLPLAESEHPGAEINPFQEQQSLRKQPKENRSMTRKRFMMKKLILVFAAIMLMMTGCGTTEKQKSSDQPKTEETKKEQVTVQITKDNGKEKVTEKKVDIAEETTVMDVMKDNFEIETQFDDSFISSIEGIAGNEQDKTSWFFSVNGEEAMKGVKEITLKPGDTVEFDFHKYE